MTIVQFSEENNKSLKTVLVWIYNGLIPMASVDRNYIPDSARIPHTSSAVKTSSIYVSIVDACIKRRHVCPKTFKMCEGEFLAIIERLVNANLIERRVADGVTYYDATPQAAQQTGSIKKFVLEAIEKVSAGVAYGVTKASLDAINVA